MKRKIAAVMACSLLTMTACGSMAETTNTETIIEQTEQTTAEETTETELTSLAETAADTTGTTTQKSEQTTAKQNEGTQSSSAAASGTVKSSGAAATERNSGSSGGSGSKTGSSGNSSKSTSTRSSTTARTTTRTSTTTKTTTKTTTAAPTDAPVTEAPATEAPVVQDGVTKIVNGVMVVNSGTDHPRALELYSGNFNNGSRYAETLNSYKAALGDAVNVYCMVVPTSQAFYTPESEAAKYGNQLDMYNHIASNLNGVTGVPVFEALDAHKGEQTYSRTDYHWQPLGAYYAAEQFAAYAGVPFAGLETYAPVVREGYVGAFYRVNNVTELGSHPEQFTYYKPANLDACTFTYYNTAFGGARQGSLFFENNSINASYTVFVGTDECILQSDTNVDNGRVLVIFKDSYGNALVPFLTQSFSKIYLCDFRYFDRNAISFIQEVGATDLLFAMSTVAVNTSSKIDKVANNLTK